MKFPRRVPERIFKVIFKGASKEQIRHTFEHAESAPDEPVEYLEELSKDREKKHWAYIFTRRLVRARIRDALNVLDINSKLVLSLLKVLDIDEENVKDEVLVEVINTLNKLQTLFSEEPNLVKIFTKETDDSLGWESGEDETLVPYKPKSLAMRSGRGRTYHELSFSEETAAIIGQIFGTYEEEPRRNSDNIPNRSHKALIICILEHGTQAPITPTRFEELTGYSHNSVTGLLAAPSLRNGLRDIGKKVVGSKKDGYLIVDITSHSNLSNARTRSVLLQVR